jgi:hypothetical protein
LANLLGGVRLERDAEGPVAVATDGRRLLVVRWPEDPGEDYPAGVGDTGHKPDFETIIPFKQWNEAAKLPPKRTPKPILSNVLVEEPSANGTVRMAATDLETVKEVRPRSLEGRYPRWRDVVPQYKALEIRVFSHSQAVDLATWFSQELCIRTVQVASGHNDPYGCVRLVYDEPQHFLLAKISEAGFEVTYFGPEAVAITIDPRYLAEVLTTMDKMNTNREAIGVDLSVPVDASRPILCRQKSSVDATGVLMPLAKDK